ncbi:MAG TPA: hypothetical protein EYQ76_04035 [Candidatus Marinimicrobia bacterium]|jgi:hypothetical protein|nr:hypothetical protein [Candidatus Neomarinimicrobiota bacterium]HIL86404.1 hypothetical protein [Candidatus Neomarinimicrobiota bacterium]
MRFLEDMILKFGSIDRRFIFILIGLAVFIPLLRPIDLPIRTTPTTEKVYNAIEAIPANSKILMSFDYGPSTKPEIHPMTLGVMRQLLRKDHQIYITCLWPDGLYMALDALEEINKEFELVEYEDYVLLGFRPGNEAVVKGIASDLRKVYTVDSKGTMLADIPMMDGVNNLKDFQFIFTGSAGYPGTFEWVQYGGDPTGVPLSSGTTSIQVNEVMPYVQSGQIRGILAGMPGAAEYEKLIGTPGIAIQGMAAQSFAHLVIVLFIILGNLAYFITERRGRKY